jgi:hypothetical protein
MMRKNFVGMMTLRNLTKVPLVGLCHFRPSGQNHGIFPYSPVVCTCRTGLFYLIPPSRCLQLWIVKIWMPAVNGWQEFSLKLKSLNPDSSIISTDSGTSMHVSDLHSQTARNVFSSASNHFRIILVRASCRIQSKIFGVLPHSSVQHSSQSLDWGNGSCIRSAAWVLTHVEHSWCKDYFCIANSGAPSSA